MRSMQPRLAKTPRTSRQGAGVEASRLLKNGAPAHAFTREDRARGGHARAEKIRRRKELSEQLDVAQREDLPAAQPELLDRALARLDLLIASADDRVALRAVQEVLDRTLGRPRQRHDFGHSQGPDMDAALAGAREKLAALIERRAARRTTHG
jgi:NAD(P)-dependent dehydrogenase (short-subunit alcohol dehydrogenase family)